ncbi:hypothetical protein AC781_04980 [Akkermansia glycaniphila]|nr:hypothetical protein AC781_04980 [Akkermansia glycaniphila]
MPGKTRRQQRKRLRSIRHGKQLPPRRQSQPRNLTARLQLRLAARIDTRCHTLRQPRQTERRQLARRRQLLPNPLHIRHAPLLHTTGKRPAHAAGPATSARRLGNIARNILPHSPGQNIQNRLPRRHHIRRTEKHRSHLPLHGKRTQNRRIHLRHTPQLAGKQYRQSSQPPPIAAAIGIPPCRPIVRTHHNPRPPLIQKHGIRSPSQHLAAIRHQRQLLPAGRNNPIPATGKHPGAQSLLLRTNPRRSACRLIPAPIGSAAQARSHLMAQSRYSTPLRYRTHTLRSTPAPGAQHQAKHIRRIRATAIGLHLTS